MKKFMKRVLFCMVLMFVCLGAVNVVGTGTGTRTVNAATSRKTVKVKKYKKTKRYKLKKTARTRTVINTRKKTTTKTYMSVAKNEKTVIVETIKTTTKYKKKLKTVTTNRTVKTTIYTTSYVRKGNATINQLKGTVDGEVIDEFKDSKFKVETNKNSFLLKGADGVFSPSNKKIVLKYNIDSVFVHELGHFVDRQNGYISGSDGFLAVYKNEKKKFNGSNKAYAQSSEREFFAEMYKEYTYNPSKIKKACPKAYAYVKNAVNAL